MATTSISAIDDTSPIYFWRETEYPYGFLSQWYTAPFTAPAHTKSKSKEPLTFVTTEQYMMYGKAMVFDDLDVAAKIMREPSPRKQKALGRKVKNFDNKVWNRHRETVVEEGNWWKFTAEKGEELGRKLADTGNRLLVEASPYDRIWGVGYPAASADANRDQWGENLLGKALMRVRERIQKQGAVEDAGTQE